MALNSRSQNQRCRMKVKSAWLVPKA